MVMNFATIFLWPPHIRTRPARCSKEYTTLAARLTLMAVSATIHYWPQFWINCIDLQCQPTIVHQQIIPAVHKWLHPACVSNNTAYPSNTGVKRWLYVSCSQHLSSPKSMYSNPPTCQQGQQGQCTIMYFHMRFHYTVNPKWATCCPT